MIPGSSAKPRVLPGKLQALLWFLIAGLAWATTPDTAAQSGLGLFLRSDWFGDPYLVTNSPGSALSQYRVFLVMNPALATNRDYQDKVSTLAAKISDQQGEWANMQTAAETARQQNRLAAQIFQALSAVSFQPKSTEALTRVASAPERGQQPDDKDDGEGKVLWWSALDNILPGRPAAGAPGVALFSRGGGGG